MERFDDDITPMLFSYIMIVGFGFFCFYLGRRSAMDEVEFTTKIPGRAYIFSPSGQPLKPEPGQPAAES